MEAVPPYPFCKKRIGDGCQRQGHSPWKPQNLCMMMPTRSDHLVLTATLQDELIRIILNSEANRSYASLRIGNKLAQQKRKKNKPYLLTMANGKPINHDDG